MQDESLTAFHEAGHVVAAHLLGRPRVREVTIEPGERSFGGVTLEESIDIEGAATRDRADIEDEIVYLLAGWEAAARASGHPQGFPRGTDGFHAESLAYAIQPAEHAEKYLLRVQQRARELVSREDVWRSIQYVAAQLRQRRTIGGEEARRLILISSPDA
jgi:hypothetical protein